MSAVSENCEEVAEARERYLRFLGNAAGSNVSLMVSTNRRAACSCDREVSKQLDWQSTKVSMFVKTKSFSNS